MTLNPRGRDVESKSISRRLRRAAVASGAVAAAALVTHQMVMRSVRDNGAEVQGSAQTEPAQPPQGADHFPQRSSDRRAVFIGGLLLVAFVFAVTAVAGVTAGDVPEWLPTLATALASGVIGGLFGLARQG